MIQDQEDVKVIDGRVVDPEVGPRVPADPGERLPEPDDPAGFVPRTPDPDREPTLDPERPPILHAGDHRSISLLDDRSSPEQERPGREGEGPR